MNRDLLNKITQNKTRIIKVTIGSLVVILIIFGVSVFRAIDRVGNYKVDKPYEDLTFTEKTAALVKGYKFETRDKLESEGLISSTTKNTTANNSNNSKTGSVLTDEQKSILSKRYEDLNDVQRTLTLEEIDKKYNALSDSEKKNVDRLKKEKDAYLDKTAKQNESNKDEYDNLKKEIESDFPDMKVTLISGADKQKTIYIDINLLYNIEATERKCAELAVMKETRLKEIGINTIAIDVKDKNGENHGSLLSELKNGKFAPTVDTIK